MKYDLIFHIKAKSDYDNAYYWYELQKEGLGERFLKQLRDKLVHIIDVPVVYGEKTKAGYREARLNDFPYVIVYKVNVAQKTIFISSIHHESKNPNKKFRK